MRINIHLPHYQGDGELLLVTSHASQSQLHYFDRDIPEGSITGHCHLFPQHPSLRSIEIVRQASPLRMKIAAFADTRSQRLKNTPFVLLL